MEKDQDRVTVLKPGRARGLGRAHVSRSGPVLVEVSGLTMRSIGPSGRPWEPAGSIDVEQLVVWALKDQKADRHVGAGLHWIEARAEGLEPNGRSTDGCAALADIEHMGCRIDRSAVTVRDLVHPAAEVVAALLFDIDGGELVRHHGKTAGRPGGWSEPMRWFRPVVWAKDGIEAQWERTGPGNSPKICRIVSVTTPAEIARRRADYERWYEALGQLAWRLSTRALGFTVQQPAAPRRPWEGQ